MVLLSDAYRTPAGARAQAIVNDMRSRSRRQTGYGSTKFKQCSCASISRWVCLVSGQNLFHRHAGLTPGTTIRAIKTGIFAATSGNRFSWWR